MNIAASQHVSDPVPVASAAERFDALIVGGGPTGYKLWRDLQRAGLTVAMLNAERWEPYNRVRLASMLSASAQIGRVLQPWDREGDGRARHFSAAKAAAIHPEERLLTTARGRIFAYRQLALCTGSVPFVPRIPGADARNVFTFRDAEDAAALRARSFGARRVAVIGGGLLGLEVARAIAELGARTTVIEHEQRLMPRQLDDRAAALLATRLRDLGVTTETGRRVAEIAAPQGQAEALVFADGSRLGVDTVVFCTGVRPETGLARAAGLAVGRGILVGPDMRTSNPSIVAAGECAELDGRIEGLVGPCLEQASVAAATIRGEAARYRPSATAAKLKVVGVDIFSIGNVEILEQRAIVSELTWSNGPRYRRVLLERGRIAGAISVGPWPEINSVQQAVTARRRIGPLARRRFRREGRLWAEARPSSPADWPSATTVCNCTGVTRGQIGQVVAAGATTLDAIRLETGASTVCGSCRPLVEEILSGAPAAIAPVRLWRPILGLSGAAALATGLTLGLPRVPVPDAFPAGLAERLWFDGVWKQWSGYTLMVISLCAMLLGLRKRVKGRHGLGAYDWWRIVHLGLGIAAVGALFAHTGFRLGDNLNAWLMGAFLLVLGSGAVAGLATGGEHRLREGGIGSAARPPRRLPTWVHILALWPLPVLLAAHIVSVYAY